MLRESMSGRRTSRIAAVSFRLLAWAALALVMPSLSARAQDQTAAAAPPPQVQQLLDLLADPAVRDWIAQHGVASPAKPAETQPVETTPSSYVTMRLTAIRQHVVGLARAVPTLSTEVEKAGVILGLEFQETGIGQVLLLILGFVALGFLLEWLFRRSTAGVARWIVGIPLDTVGQRLRAAAIRLSYGMGLVIAFAVGSVGAFLANEWPPLLREIVLGYLMAFLILRTALVICRFLMAPGGERFRLVPMGTPAAWFWYRRIGLAVGWLAFGWVTVGLLGTLGLPMPHRQLVAYILGLCLLAIGLEAIWHAAPGAAPAIENGHGGRHMSHRAVSWLISGYFGLLWLFWVASMMPIFWLAVVAVALPAAMRLARQSVDHLLRPAGSATAASEVPTMQAVLLERGLRTVLIIGAALLLAHAWQIDLTALAATDTVATRLMRGAVSAVVILLIADFTWRLARALIDGKIAEAHHPGQPDSEENRRRSRLRTLLPIVRNILFVVLLVMAGLMVLSSMGVEIGPLIAGAGVVGVAIGFGAQTLVKDIISGMFFLLDDAFRVGEYIQSGSYKGTVESFSLRSIKLRHHRGPLYTVPFGVLGAVENMSRDWVIDKMKIGITYDSDLEKARKLIKQVGKDLAEDPEYKPHIIETLKMQGVEEFGDYAIQIRMKMTTKPGEQFVIRRKAYGLIKKAFDVNGIKFAFPTVQVAGGDDTTAAIAQQSLANAKPVEPPA